MYKITTGSTNEAENFFRSNIANIGEVKSISHKRDKESIFYETIIVGNDETIIIEGGLTSGYSGEGSHGFFNILTSLGIDEDKANMYAFGNSDEPQFDFEIYFD